MKQKLIIFDPQSLKDLLVHYTEGAVPPDSEAVGLSASRILERYLCLEVRSASWAVEDEVDENGMLVPLIIRFEGNRIFKIERPQDAGPGAWGEFGAVEAPKQS